MVENYDDFKTTLETCVGDLLGSRIGEMMKLQAQVSKHWRPVMKPLQTTSSLVALKFTSVFQLDTVTTERVDFLGKSGEGGRWLC